MSTHQRNQESTIWVGNLDTQCSEELVFELFLQVGPVTNVNMPRDKITNLHQGNVVSSIQFNVCACW
jgi:splicing factor 3B subunit 4